MAQPARPHDGWAVLEAAFAAGYDYLYLTADELPMTFAKLLTAMDATRPDWWSALREEERPVLVGYGRADGVADPRRTALLTSLGVRQIMIGMDAGTPLSLAAMNKPLGGRRRDVLAEAETLYRLNSTAITVARDHGLLIRAGFVVGHIGMIGMTRQLLTDNVERILALVSEGATSGVFSAVDIEVLPPSRAPATTPTSPRLKQHRPLPRASALPSPTTRCSPRSPRAGADRPSSISPLRLQQAVPGSDFSVARLARTLETTTAHVVHLLAEHPVDWSPPRFRRTQRAASRSAQWRLWYERDLLSLQAIADREDTSLATIRTAPGSAPLAPIQAGRGGSELRGGQETPVVS
ncbi:hypothetical protein ABZT04_44150 [Streptomyces sp. NPDC005492]|uniref:hypothetical protein n=1 Tax=Streptomyces sp. NPDC005492 TaxID=3156883 RepID=UPI0033ACD38B